MCVQALLRQTQRWKRHEAAPSPGPGPRISAVSGTLLLFDFYTEMLKRDAGGGIPLWRTLMELDALRSTNYIHNG